ncbi:hypothetical protein TESG_08676 [Trichophyton tonsurans CBS 112818]|uniref:Uncharacterized protein n=1 Tax=Trichophyton tonsurans (strain CBS 112818) TaxID=647933 RepID=F2SBE6_TRIT1|nr:hypothetical protein TESG_08676 [Trichophyton tonsurans CBS 112818]
MSLPISETLDNARALPFAQPSRPPPVRLASQSTPQHSTYAVSQSKLSDYPLYQVARYNIQQYTGEVSLFDTRMDRWRALLYPFHTWLSADTTAYQCYLRDERCTNRTNPVSRGARVTYIDMSYRCSVYPCSAYFGSLGLHASQPQGWAAWKSL